MLGTARPNVARDNCPFRLLRKTLETESLPKRRPLRHELSHPVIVNFGNGKLSDFTQYRSMIPARPAPHKKDEGHERGLNSEAKPRAYDVH